MFNIRMQAPAALNIPGLRNTGAEALALEPNCQTINGVTLEAVQLHGYYAVRCRSVLHITKFRTVRFKRNTQRTADTINAIRRLILMAVSAGVLMLTTGLPLARADERAASTAKICRGMVGARRLGVSDANNMLIRACDGSLRKLRAGDSTDRAAALSIEDCLSLQYEAYEDFEMCWKLLPQ